MGNGSQASVPASRVVAVKNSQAQRPAIQNIMQTEDLNNSNKHQASSQLAQDKKLGATYKILAIETSFDETAVSVLEYTDLYNHKILSEELSSQVKIHAEYGGVVPEIASREHLNNLKKILKIALEKANLTLDEIDLISATRGPGLKGCLLIGYDFAKGLAIARKAIKKEIPFIGVNHIEGHVFSTFLEPENKALKFPFISLVVSGAHTELHIIHDFDRYELFSKTPQNSYAKGTQSQTPCIAYGHSAIEFITTNQFLVICKT